MIYFHTKSFPSSEKYSLTDQLRRCSISITSNIAEGFGRNSMKEKIQFYYLSQGSLLELKNQIILAKDLTYIKERDYTKLLEQITHTHKLLQGLISKSKSFIPES